MGTAQVFIPLMRFLLKCFVSRSFLVCMKYSFLIFYFHLPLFDGVCFQYSQVYVSFLFFERSDFFLDLLVLLLLLLLLLWKLFVSPSADGLSVCLIDSKSPRFFRTLFSILIDFSNAVVWMVSSRPLISKPSSPCTKHLATISSAPVTIGITDSFMFHVFFSSLARSRYLSPLIIILPFWNFFTPALADGFSLEFEWQQVSSSPQDCSQYSGWY